MCCESLFVSSKIRGRLRRTGLVSHFLGQAECYGDRWFNSNQKYHQELDSVGLWDQRLTESGMKLGDVVDAQEFEAVWKLSNQVSVVTG
jgi:hypothetical protein